MHIVDPEELDRSFEAGKVKYIKFDNTQSIKFTKLESSTSQG